MTRPATGASRRAATLLALAVLALGLLATAVTDAVLTREADRRVDESLARRSDAVAAAVRDEVSRYESSVELVAAAAEAGGGDFGPTAFERATSPLRGMDLAGATSVAFLTRPVTDDGVAAMQRTWRDRGVDGLVLEPDAGSARHVFAVMSVPLDGATQNRVGIDVSVSGAPYAAVLEAERTGRLAITEPYQLIIDQDLPPEDRQASFSLVAPVWGDDGDGTPDLRGWILMGIRGRDFLGHVLAEAAQGEVAVGLEAGDGTGATTTVATAGDARDDADESRTTAVPVAQRSWSLTTSASHDDLAGSPRTMAAITGSAGTALALVLAGLVWLLATARDRERARVRQATAELATSVAGARRQAVVLAAVLESTSNGVAVVDEQGSFLYHNPAALKMLGVASPAAENGVAADLTDPADWSRHYGVAHPDGTPLPVAELPLVRALSGEEVDGVELLVRNRHHPEGLRIAVSARPLDLGGVRRGAATVFHDITAEREQQAELAAFAGVVAHDLKSPLSSVQGYLEVLEDVTLPLVAGSDEAVAQALLQVRRAAGAAGRMDHLIEDLLAFTTARDAVLDLAPVDLDTLTSEVIDAHVERVVHADRPLPIIHVGSLPTVLGDANRLRQVVDNLVGNALKYSPPGQQPIIAITGGVAPDPDVPEGEHAWLEVADRGVGIPAEHLQDVFAPFHRAHADSYVGTGLGLAICQRTVVRHGGTIEALPHAGGGTRFVVTLPAAPRTEPSSLEEAGATS